MKSDVVNIADFELISGIIPKPRIFAFIQFSLVSPIGREILHALDEKPYVKVTLNAGRRNLKLHINDSAWMFFEQGNNCA
jgi:hypothetical protein